MEMTLSGVASGTMVAWFSRCLGGRFYDGAGNEPWRTLLMRVERGELRVEDAAGLLGLKRRQVFRLVERMRSDGAAGLISRKRGRPSYRRRSDAFREQIFAIVREHYQDFGPTLGRVRRGGAGTVDPRQDQVLVRQPELAG